MMSPSKYFSDREDNVCPRGDVFPCFSIVLTKGSMGFLSGKAQEESNFDEIEVEGREAVGEEGEGF